MKLPLANTFQTFSFQYDVAKEGTTGTFIINCKPPKNAINIIIVKQNIVPLVGAPGSAILIGEENFPGLFGQENQPNFFNNSQFGALGVSQGEKLRFDILGNLISGRVAFFMIFGVMKF